MKAWGGRNPSRLCAPVSGRATSPWHLSGGEECRPRKCGFQPILALCPLQEAVPGQALFAGLKIKASWPGPCWQRGGGGLKGVWLAKETSPAPPPAKLGVRGVPRELLAPQLSCHERRRRVGVWVLAALSSATQVCLSPSSDASNNLGLLGYTSTPIPSFPYPLTMIAMSRWPWWGRHYYYYHWTSEEIKAQRGLVTWSRPHSSSVEEPELNRGLSDS